MAGRLTVVPTSRAIGVLLDGIVDYAGLFPPAALSMDRAVADYAEARQGTSAWMLGRFVLPADRLDVFERSLAALPHLPCEAWCLSAVVGAEAEQAIARVDDFNRRRTAAADGTPVRVDAVEIKVESAQALETLAPALRPELETFIEIPAAADPPQLETLVSRIAALGLRAKIRTGGITAPAFPSPAAVARFLVTCRRFAVPFKATAGLHHPVRGDYRLTYEPSSDSARMFGFLNVALASAAAREGMSEPDLVRLLEERSPQAFVFSDEGASWRGTSISMDALIAARHIGLLGFGSCSFREPVADLTTLHLFDA